jgi:hypothetical protein
MGIERLGNLGIGAAIEVQKNLRLALLKSCYEGYLVLKFSKLKELVLQGAQQKMLLINYKENRINEGF